MSRPLWNARSSIPVHRARQACPSEKLLEGPACQVRGSIMDDRPAFPGHDRRSPVGAIHELPLQHRRDLLVTSACLGGTCSSRPPWNARSSIPFHRARQACPSEKLPEGPACHVRLSRRDVPVTSAVERSIIHPLSSGTTSVPLRKTSGGTCLSRPLVSEGRACHVRCGTLDHPSPFIGHDRRSPVGAIHELPLQHRRDLPVRSAVPSWMIDRLCPGATTCPSESGRREAGKRPGRVPCGPCGNFDFLL
ncbi:MAG: hypothetical protein KatS3mg112_0112 [Thermogutta sp.]|nr:MAG: hypothetical protein KatS3mg112_0112 [Thermogutta sp.]